MFGIGLLIIFLLHFPPSFAQCSSSQLPNANLNPRFLGNSGNEEDIAKLRLIKKCLSNLKDCAKGISLKEVIQEVTSTSGIIGHKTSIHVCEGQTENITCPPDFVIKVHDGFYGRMDNTTCSSEKTDSTNCKANNSLLVLQYHCDNHQTCNIESNYSHFGEPCYGTEKYISMTYSCQISDEVLSSKRFSLNGSNRTYWLTSKRYNNSHGSKENCKLYDGILATLDAKSCVNQKLVGSYLKFFLLSKEKVWVKKRNGNNESENSPLFDDRLRLNSSYTISPTKSSADGSKGEEDCILMDIETFQEIETRQVGGDQDHYGLCVMEIPPL